MGLVGQFYRDWLPPATKGIPDTCRGVLGDPHRACPPQTLAGSGQNSRAQIACLYSLTTEKGHRAILPELATPGGKGDPGHVLLGGPLSIHPTHLLVQATSHPMVPGQIVCLNPSTTEACGVILPGLGLAAPGSGGIPNTCRGVLGGPQRAHSPQTVQAKTHHGVQISCLNT